MKKALSIALILCVIAKAFMPFFFFTYYYQNKQQIISLYCENKQKIEKKCEGKCYLKKQIDKATDEEQKSEFKFKKPHEVFSIVSSKFELRLHSATSSITCKPYFFSVISAHLSSNHQPPRAI
ncbi:MAG: hypothetical protein NZM38_04265 [Cytophagales bacterium]|nr:hypothetical protein [Cytophagales bacterium]MDW8383966.1 hypothetical protein [Flammeovirgaceae bacterium]